jgi:hypothetical protein
MSDVNDFEIREVFLMDAIDHNFWLETYEQVMIVNLSSDMKNTLVEVCGIYKSEILVGICLIPSLFVKSNEKFSMQFEIERNSNLENNQIKKLKMFKKDNNFMKLFSNKSSLINSLLFDSTVLLSVEGIPTLTVLEFFYDDFNICVDPDSSSEYLQINLELGEYFLYGNAQINTKTSLYDTFDQEIAFIVHEEYIQDFFNSHEINITKYQTS